MSKTMGEVLAEHQRWVSSCGPEQECECGVRLVENSDAGMAAHQAEVLSAAGFGLVADAKAEAWDHGHHDGAVDAMLHMENDGAKTTPNPYRAAS